ncbi:MAG: CPBP family intramembrane metalloprotease [Myxococcales bacterium]|nr:CPBP family intramembrane metalloprotease [Myxococcales bacterium]
MEPASPSPAEEPPDDSVEPIGLGAATLWALGAQLSFLFVLTLVLGLAGAAPHSSLRNVGCQVVGYGLVVGAMHRLYAPRLSLSKVVALGRSHLGFLPLAVLVGAGATLPTYALRAAIERVLPSEQGSFTATAEAFYQLDLGHQILATLALVVVGPVVEEVLFRGAIYGGLVRTHSPRITVVTTGGLFALIHLQPLAPELQLLPPLWLMGCLLGYLRWASGSLVPPVLLHIAYNAVPVLPMVGVHAAPTTTATPEESWPWVLGSLAVTLLALLATQALARHLFRRGASPATPEP